MIIRSGLDSGIVTTSISLPFLSTGVVYTVHWRCASRLCEPIDKIIFSRVYRPARAVGCTASMAFRNSGLTMSVHVRGHGVGRTACLHRGHCSFLSDVTILILSRRAKDGRAG